MTSMGTPEKCMSDPNLSKPSSDDASHTLVYVRNKRKRRDSYSPEFDAFKEEIKELIEAWMKQHDYRLGKISTTLEGIEKTNSDIEASISFLNTQYEEIKCRVVKLETEKREEQECIQILKEKIEDLQRSARKSSLELRNAPSTKIESKEDLTKSFMKLAKSNNVTINQNDIRDIYRVKGYNNTNSSIIIAARPPRHHLRTNIPRTAGCYAPVRGRLSWASSTRFHLAW